jgi:hypothetical protein
MDPTDSSYGNKSENAVRTMAPSRAGEAGVGAFAPHWYGGVLVLNFPPLVQRSSRKYSNGLKVEIECSTEPCLADQRRKSANLKTGTSVTFGRTPNAVSVTSLT